LTVWDFFSRHNSHLWSRASSLSRFHIDTHSTTLGRTPGRVINPTQRPLTTHSTYRRETSMPQPRQLSGRSPTP